MFGSLDEILQNDWNERTDMHDCTGVSTWWPTGFERTWWWTVRGLSSHPWTISASVSPWPSQYRLQVEQTSGIFRDEVWVGLFYGGTVVYACVGLPCTPSRTRTSGETGKSQPGTVGILGLCSYHHTRNLTGFPEWFCVSNAKRAPTLTPSSFQNRLLASNANLQGCFQPARRQRKEAHPRGAPSRDCKAARAKPLGQVSASHGSTQRWAECGDIWILHHGLTDVGSKTLPVLNNHSQPAWSWSIESGARLELVNLRCMAFPGSTNMYPTRLKFVARPWICYIPCARRSIKELHPRIVHTPTPSTWQNCYCRAVATTMAIAALAEAQLAEAAKGDKDLLALMKTSSLLPSLSGRMSEWTWTPSWDYTKLGDNIMNRSGCARSWLVSEPLGG